MTVTKTTPYADWVRGKSCTAKVAYSGEQVARNAATAYRWSSGTVTYPYQCRHCQEWHLTSQPQGK